MIADGMVDVSFPTVKIFEKHVKGMSKARQKQFTV
jgi:hypothetical protein